MKSKAPPFPRSRQAGRALLAALVVMVNPVTAATAKPNIMIILADDLGWSDLGCYGGEIRTPHLDSLAKGGLRFTEFYTSSRCCPSRAALLTGLYPHQAGLGLMTSVEASKFHGKGAGEEKFPGYRGALNESCVTIAQVLKPAGYRTAAVGKWHVGDHQPPTARGFDDFYGFVRGYGVDSWEPRMMTRLPEGKPQRGYQPGEFFATDAITDHALDFLSDMRGSKARRGSYTWPIRHRISQSPLAWTTWRATRKFTRKDGTASASNVSRGRKKSAYCRKTPRSLLAARFQTPRPPNARVR